MGCCGPQGNNRFEPNIAVKVVLGILVLAMFLAALTRLIPADNSLLFPTAPDTPVKIKYGNDFFLGSNPAGYQGYIRFNPGQGQVKVVLKRNGHDPFTHDILLMVLGPDQRALGSVRFPANDFTGLKFGYAQNVQRLRLPPAGDGEYYFSYSLSER